MISTGDRSEITIHNALVKIDRVWGSGVRTCGDYWIGLEKVAYFILPLFASNEGAGGTAVVLAGGEERFRGYPAGLKDAAKMIEDELLRLIESKAYDKASLKRFQSSKYFNRGEMPVVFEMEK